MGIWLALVVLFTAAFVYIAPSNPQEAVVYFLTPAAVAAALAKLLNQRISTVALGAGLGILATALLYTPGWVYGFVKKYVQMNLENAVLFYAVAAAGVLTPYVLTLMHLAATKRRYTSIRRSLAAGA